MTESPWKKASRCISKICSRGFERWSVCVYTRSGYVIVGSLLLVTLSIYGFLLHEVETVGEKLWIPKKAESLQDKAQADDVFSNQPRPSVVYLVPKDQSKTVISLEAFEAILSFHTRFISEVEFEGHTFSDLCYKTHEEDTCRSPNHPLAFVEVAAGVYDLSRVKTNDELVQLVNTGKGQPELYPEGSPRYINVEYMFGSVTPTDFHVASDGSNNIQTAQAVTWLYELGSKKDLTVYEGYETALEEFAAQFNDENELISVHWYTYSSVDRASKEAVGEDTILMQLGITFTVIYVLFSVSKLHIYRSRSLVGMVGIISVGLAYVETISVGSLIGIKGSLVTQVLPFIMLGIGVDDMFVLLHSLDQAPAKMLPREQFLYMMEHAGPSIALTSLTNILSFLVGSLTSIPAIRNFCFYASLGILFDFLNQVSFFAAAVAIDLRRSEKEIGDCCSACFWAPGSKLCCKGKFIFDAEGNVKSPIFTRFMRNVYGPAITSTPGKIVGALFTITFIAFNAYNASLLRYHFDYERFVPVGTYAHTTIEVRDEHFDRTPWSPAFYTLGAEFETKDSQLSLLLLTDKLMNCYGCEKTWVIEGSVVSWYPAFNNWVYQGECSVAHLEEDVVPPSFFYDCFYQWMQTTEGQSFSANLVLDADGRILGASMSFLAKWRESNEDLLQLVADTRDLSEYGPDDSFPFYMIYKLADQAMVFASETLLSLACSTLLVAVVVFITLRTFLLATYVMFTVFLTCLAMLALLEYSQVYMNVMTMINIIISIGVTVDFSLHVAYAYQKAPGLFRRERVINALEHIGASVIDGGLSTILALLPLIFSKSFVFTVFFYAWMGIIGFGLVHSLIVLPVILATIGTLPKKFSQVAAAETEYSQQRESIPKT